MSRSLRQEMKMRSMMVLGGLVFGMSVACGDDFTSASVDSKGDGGVAPINGGGQDDAGADARAVMDAAADAPIAVVDAQPPPQCDGSKRPAEDACVIDDAFGVFVSASLGNDANNGSKQKPFATLAKAMAAAKQAGRRVYACAETFGESVTFVEGVAMFGYFDCASGWKVSSGRATVASPSSPAATATNISKETRVESFEIDAPDASTPGGSSIGLLANGSSGLHFVGSKIHAGNGGKGADGAPGIQLTEAGNKNGTGGSDETNCGLVPLKQRAQCEALRNVVPGGSMQCIGEPGHDPAAGGNGGSGGAFVVVCNLNVCFFNNANPPTTDGAPNVSSSQVNKGGAMAGPWPGSDGVAGQAGSSGTVGGSLGTISPSGYVTSDGTKGTAGSPGQSGGGGAGRPAGVENDANGYGQASDVWGSSGGGGGTGGCPGLPGAPAQGGGASIAVLATKSPMTFDGTSLETSVGGAGGAAGSASQPTAGGIGGPAPKYFNGMTLVTLSGHGGNGGMGGIAGASGSGGGGPSIPVAYSTGAVPTFNSCVITVGKGGTGGGSDPKAPDGLVTDKYAF